MIVVFGYNFPHYKTQAGLVNLVCNGITPGLVILQDRKELNIPSSSYRVTPAGEYYVEPSRLCRALRIPYLVMDHDDIYFDGWLGIILGARILKQSTIDRFEGILNIHPGILPGNRGLDNLKWSLIKGLPIGVAAHYIDHRVDMGYLIRTEELQPEPGESIRDIYIRQRNLEQKVLVEVTQEIIKTGIKKDNPVPWSQKFSAVPQELDTW